MSRALLRILFSRPVWMVGVSMVLAGFWMVWWAWPERPLRELKLLGQSMGTSKIAPDGASMITTLYSVPIGSGGGTSRMALMNLSDGSFHFPFSADETKAKLHVTPFYLDGGRLLMLSWPTALRLIDTMSGAVLWEAANLGYHRSWSDDGRLVVAESRDDATKMDRTLLFDTAEKSVKELPQVEGPFGFDKSGDRLLTRVEADPAVFAIWNTTTKTEIARFQDARYQSIYGAAINPAGTQVIVVAKVPNAPDEERRGGFLWNLDNGRVDLLELPERTKDYVSGHLEFTRDGQSIFGPDGYPRWAIKAGSTQKIEPAREFIWRGFPQAKRYLASRDLKQTYNSNSCTLFDDETNLPIASRDWASGSSLAIMSPDARWMMIPNHQAPNWVTQSFNRLLMMLRRDTMSSQHLDIVSLENGRIRNCIPLAETNQSHAGYIGFAQQDCLWSFRIVPHREDAKAEFILQEWSCYAAWPPWWLWLVTVGGIALMVWKTRNRSRVGMMAPAR